MLCFSLLPFLLFFFFFFFWLVGCLFVKRMLLLLFIGCLISPQHSDCVSGKDLLRHTETKLTDQTVYLTQSHYPNTGPTNPSTVPIIQGDWQGSHQIRLKSLYDSTAHTGDGSLRLSPGNALLLGQRSFTSRWHRSARKGSYTLLPASQKSPKGCPRNSANVCLVEHRLFPTSEGGMLAASFLNSREELYMYIVLKRSTCPLKHV